MKFNPAHPVPCVYLKHGAYWLVKKGKWERLGGNLAEALEAYGRLAQAKNKGDLAPMLERAFLHHQKVKKLAVNTLRHYRVSLDTLTRRFAQFDVGQVKEKHVARFKAEGVDQPNMTNRSVSLLRVLFSYLVEWQIVDSNPCVGVRRLEEAKRKRYVTDGEFFAIRGKAEPRLQVIMDLQYLTGQRISDVLNIHRRDLTPEGIFFKPAKTENSTGAKICVQWNDELRVAVARAKELQGSVQTLWLLGSRSRKAPNYDTVARQFRAAAERAGIKGVRPNDQRAKSLTDANKQGENATALAAHADPKMTQRYLRLFETVLVNGPTFLDRR